jgi:exopolysaccharide biosynthesis polyprenyl glycosylphosphotransferase
MISYRYRGFVNLYLVASTTLVACFFLLYASSTQYLPWVDVSRHVNLTLYFLAVVAGMLASSRYAGKLRLQFHRLTWVDAASLAFRQVTIVALVIFTLIVASKDRDVSRVFLSSFLVLSWVLLLFVNSLVPRMLASLAFQRQHRLPTLFIGKHRHLSKLSEWIAQKERLGITPVGFLSDDPIPDANLAEATRFLGPVSSLKRMIEEKNVGQLILLDLPTREKEMALVIEACQEAGCRLLIHSNIQEQFPVPLTPLIEEGHLFLTFQDEPLEDPMNRAMKRAFDIAISLPVVLFILPPLSIGVWVAQRLQAPGPLFFVRPRGGQRRTEFPMLKFRSMYYMKPDENAEAQQARSRDARIYPFGAFLRRSSLDEFPQFFNVLKGEMSIVGPRPHLPKHDQEFARQEKTYRSRHLVKPGITGLAQTSGLRGEITDPVMLSHRVHLDIRYITQWSIWLDFQLTLKTLWQVFFPPKTAF